MAAHFAAISALARAITPRFYEVVYTLGARRQQGVLAGDIGIDRDRLRARRESGMPHKLRDERRALLDPVVLGEPDAPSKSATTSPSAAIVLE